MSSDRVYRWHHLESFIICLSSRSF